MIDKSVSLKELIAIVLADIDIYLLQEKDLDIDKNKLFTVKEVRNQMYLTMQKFESIMTVQLNYDINKPLDFLVKGHPMPANNILKNICLN